MMESVPWGVRCEGLGLQGRGHRCLPPPRGRLHGWFRLSILGVLAGCGAFAGGAEVQLSWGT